MLQVEKVGIHDNFFDLGGHSLLIVQAHSKLQELLQRDISILELFQYPTISSLAQYLSEEKSERSALAESEVRVGKLKEGKNRLRQKLTQRQKSIVEPLKEGVR